MKAAVLHALNQPLIVRTGIRPPPLRRGQVFVKIAYSGVCHSQLMEVRGQRGPDIHLPHLLGHEGSGVVMDVGPEVTKVGPGDRVVLGWIRGSGIDAGGAEYACGSEVLSAGAVTTFNDHAVVSENRCVKVPEGVPLDVAVLFGCAIPTGCGIVTNTIRPDRGASVAIFGLGGIGLSALLALRLFECATVIAVDVAPDKLQLAREFGATDTVDASERDPVQAVREITKGRGVDYSVEAAGLSRTIEQAFSAVRRGGGLCVFASHPQNGSHITLDPYEMICGKRIQGSWGGSSDPDRDIPMFSALYREGKLPLEKLITRRYSLEQINQALDDLEQNRVARPLIIIDPSLSAGQ
jgi:S-(hydroxymethyl)glutathione dehydrogenase/alcohol dehydrogenase